MTKFSRWELRTTDTSAASAFYPKLFGHDRAVIWALHEQALARGAKPHWLGHVEVGDVERTSQAFVERGAMRLGPTMTRPDGMQIAVLRDPGGAILALSSAVPSPSTLLPALHVLNTNDAPRAIANYRELFGWEFSAPEEVPGQGEVHPFAWQPGGPKVGIVVDITGMAGRHPHWLFFFRVPTLAPAIAATREAGGLALDPIVMPNGDRLCACDDAQGAAFGLLEPGKRIES